MNRQSAATRRRSDDPVKHTFSLRRGEDDDLIRLLAQYERDGFNLSGIIRDLMRHGADLPVARPLDAETLRSELARLKDDILDNMPQVVVATPSRRAPSRASIDVNDKGKNIPDF